MADVRRVTTLHTNGHTPRKKLNQMRTVSAHELTTMEHQSSHDVDEPGALTAASQIITDINRYRPLWYETWQEEAWDFYESLGEFNYGVEWFSEALSRVRLTAAKVTPGGDEPEVLDSGAASDLVTRFMGGIDGQSQLLRSLAVQLSVAGDAYLVGRDVTDADIVYGLLMDAEPDENGRIWTVNPTNTLRRHRGRFTNLFRRQGQRYSWEIQLDETAWVPLPPESLVVRIWDRNEHYPWRSISPAKPSLPIMREIDMYNRHIIASLVSRVAMNGMLFIPDEVTLPASPQYENASDPFIAELLDIMMAAIKNPGSPAAAAPVPVRIPAEFIDRFKHMSFATALDGEVFESRAQAIRRLAATLNLPQEIITGLGTVNHWSSWQLTEDAIKIHISPKVEIITRALTLGYLHPMLEAMGESTRASDGSRIIFWYDTSELTQRPDRSGAALSLREMMVINDKAARRETGFDEADAPTDDELEKMILMKLAVNPRTAAPALKELTGLEFDILPEEELRQSSQNDNMITTDQQDIDAGQPVAEAPDTQNDETMTPDEAAMTAAFNRLPAERRAEIVRKTHSIRRRARESLTRSNE